MVKKQLLPPIHNMTPIPTNTSPSLQLYQNLQTAFDFFNQQLFNNQLPACLLTLRSNNRIHGYHHSGRFTSAQGEKIDELGLHPGFFTLLPIEVVLSTLVHEMVHHWQDNLGHPSKSNPHNAEWAKKMEAIGLMPSKTGLPGGEKTGQKMSHYIIPDAGFIKSCQTLLQTGFQLGIFDRHVPSSPQQTKLHQESLINAGIEIKLSDAPLASLPAQLDGKPTIFVPVKKITERKLTLVCSSCLAKAWVHEGTSIQCGNCGISMKQLEPA